MESIRRQLLIVACVNLGQLQIGYTVGWSAPIIPKLQDLETSPLPEAVTDAQASWIGSLLYVGCVVGPYVTGIIANLFGRKPSLIIGCFMSLTGYLLVATTNNIAMVYAARLISGFGSGITTVGNIVYVGEIASNHIRGILLISTSIGAVAGTLLMYSIGPYVSYAVTGYIALGISGLHMLSLLFIVPESPLYHAMKDQDKKVTSVLNLLGRSADVENILKAGATKKGEEASNIKDWTDIITIKSNRKSLFISFMLGAFQQFSGVIVVLFYATTIFQLAGSSVEPGVATIIIGATRLVASFIAPLVVETQGRKIPLLISMGICAITMTLLGVYFHLDGIGSPVVESIGWLPLVLLIVFFFSFDAGLGSMLSAVIGEMFRANVRSNGSTLAMTFAWLVGFPLTTNFNAMVNSLGGDVTFWIFGGSCTVACAFILFFVPETKGKTLLEIQEMLS